MATLVLLYYNLHFIYASRQGPESASLFAFSFTPLYSVQHSVCVLPSAASAQSAQLSLRPGTEQGIDRSIADATERNGHTL